MPNYRSDGPNQLTKDPNAREIAELMSLSDEQYDEIYGDEDEYPVSEYEGPLFPVTGVNGEDEAAPGGPLDPSRLWVLKAIQNGFDEEIVYSLAEMEEALKDTLSEISFYVEAADKFSFGHWFLLLEDDEITLSGMNEKAIEMIESLSKIIGTLEHMSTFIGDNESDKDAISGAIEIADLIRETVEHVLLREGARVEDAIEDN